MKYRGTNSPAFPSPSPSSLFRLCFILFSSGKICLQEFIERTFIDCFTRKPAPCVALIAGNVDDMGFSFIFAEVNIAVVRIQIKKEYHIRVPPYPEHMAEPAIRRVFCFRQPQSVFQSVCFHCFVYHILYTLDSLCDIGGVSFLRCFRIVLDHTDKIERVQRAPVDE